MDDEDARERMGRIRAGGLDPIVVAAGVASTLLLHAFIVGMVVWGTMSGDDAEEKTDDKKMEFEDVELLSLGEEKPSNQLPRIANPSPAPAEQETVTLEEEEKPEKKKKKKEKDEPEEQPREEPPEEPPEPDQEPSEAESREKAMNEAFDSLHDPQRPTNDDVPEGSKKGVAAGTVADEALANLMGTFKAKLLEKIGEHWRIPTTISDEQLDELTGKVKVYVRLSENGHVVSYRFLRRSGHSQFDGSIERVMQQFQAGKGGRTLPMPENDKVHTAVLEDGLQLVSWGRTQE